MSMNIIKRVFTIVQEFNKEEKCISFSASYRYSQLMSLPSNISAKIGSNPQVIIFNLTDLVIY